MPGNRRRNANAVPLASMATWIVVCLFLGVAGLGYVWLKNQLHLSGGSIKQFEREYAQLMTQNETVRIRIVELSSMDAIKKRYDGDKSRLGGLIGILQDKIVFVNRPPRAVAESTNDVRKVVNREGITP